MKKGKNFGGVLSSLLVFSLFSCNQYSVGRIDFELNGGSFNDESFSTTYLQGKAGDPITTVIPDPVKSGYYFVGWREKNNSGAYRVVNKILADDGNSYYHYPYGNDIFYAYFEPLVQINFDLGVAKDREGAIVAPKQGATNFSESVLNGYATKTIDSTDYLPTATGTHLNFSYWYTTKPLAKTQETDGTIHYSLDSTGADGIYQFDKSFGTDGMAFPLLASGETFTLYAFFEEDPKITVNFNLEGVEPAVFQTEKDGDNISADLIKCIKTAINIDLSSSEDIYYPNKSEKTKRLAGLFLDTEFKKPFYLNSSVGNKDLSLYMKWNSKVSVTLDYNGGNLSGETTFVSTHYSDDILGDEFLTAHTPAKDNSDFIGFNLEGNAFDFAKTKLPSNNITLIAQYSDYPTLTLKGLYPASYTGEKISDVLIQKKAGTDISALLENFKGTLTGTSLEANIFKTKAADTDVYTAYTKTMMPDKSMNLYLQINYKMVITLKTLKDDGSAFTDVSQAIDKVSYFGIGDTVDYSSFADLKENLVEGEDTYLYNGLYSDAALSLDIILPLSGDSSFTSAPSLNIYRKYTKGVILSFVQSDKVTIINGTDSNSLKYMVLPNGSTSSVYDEIVSLLNIGTKTVSSLAVLNADNTTSVLGNVLPSANATIVVTYNA